MQHASENGTSARRTLLELAALEKRDFRATLQRILQADADALQVERVGYWRINDDGTTLTSELGYVRNLQAFERGITIREQQYPEYFRAIREDNVIVADDAQRDSRTSELRAAYLEPLGVVSMMDVPVWSGGRLVGVLCHEHTGGPRHWTAEECDLSLAVAQTIATTHESHARWLAEEVARRALFLSDASEALAGVLDVEEVPEQIARCAVREIADWCVLQAPDEWGKLQAMVAAHRHAHQQPLVDELAQYCPQQASHSHLVLRSLRTGRSLLFPVASDEVLRRFGLAQEEAKALVRQLGAQSAMLVPLVARGRVLAVLTLVSSERVFRRDDLQLAEDFARRAALHLDNARLYREARDAVRARDEFIAVASHELNTPLASMGLSVDALRKGLFSGSPEATARASELVQRQQRRLSRLVREMLDVTRIQSGRLVLKREDMSLSELVRELCLAFEPQLTAAGASLQCHIEEEVRGRWDRARLERVLDNLLSNALKFGAGAPVELELRSRSDDLVELRVTDHGIGIPRERQPYVFERFERAVSSKEFAGLGLGLYIARGVIDAHGGKIHVASRPGRGTTFTVELPTDPVVAKRSA